MLLELLGTISLIFVLYFFFTSRRISAARLPGPPRWPILGHLTIFPTEKPWEQFHRWCKQLGTDAIELDILGKRIVVLDSAKAARDLLDRKSAVYSGRPRMPMVNELMGWDFNFGAMDYGPRWRAHRKAFEPSFGTEQVKMYYPAQVHACHDLLFNLADSPDRFLDHFRHMAGSITLGVAYGIQTQSESLQDPFIKMLEAGTQPVLEAVIPGTYLVDIFPIMKHIPEWFPGARFKTIARETRVLSDRMLYEPFEETKRMMATGKCAPSYVSMALQEGNIPEDIIRNAAGSMYSAGSDNVISTLAGFLVFMMTTTAAQMKAQTELDSVVQPGQLPSYSDMNSLPYVTAMVIEVFRCAITSPIGAPHVLQEDDVYNGNFLSKGTLVFANVWSILHDEKKYPEPFSFKPERFLHNGDLTTDAKEIAPAFGFGRRLCPGRHMGFNTVWMAIASVLTVFEISAPTDGQGNPVYPDLQYSKASSCVPMPFKCNIRMRPGAKERLSYLATAR